MPQPEQGAQPAQPTHRIIGVPSSEDLALTPRQRREFARLREMENPDRCNGQKVIGGPHCLCRHDHPPPTTLGDDLAALIATGQVGLGSAD